MGEIGGAGTLGQSYCTCMYKVRKIWEGEGRGGGGGWVRGMSEARTLGLRYCTCMYKVTVTWCFTPQSTSAVISGLIGSDKVRKS